MIDQSITVGGIKMPKANPEGYKIIERMVKQKKDIDALKMAMKLGVNDRTIYKWRQKARRVLGMDVVIKDRRKKQHDRRRFKGGGGIETFQNIFDDSVKVPHLIEEGIEKYLTNKDGEPDWMYDYAFREMCGVSVTKWRRYADQYKHLQVKASDGQLIWGHPDIIDEMREILLR